MTKEYCIFGQDILIILWEHKERERKKKCVLLSDDTLWGFKVDGLFLYATLLLIFDLVKRDISDRFPTTTAEREPGTEKSKI